MVKLVCVVGVVVSGASAGVGDRGLGFPMEVPVDGVMSWDLLGSPVNESVVYEPPFAVEALTIAWDLTLTTFGGSWASEAAIGVFADESLTFSLTPGVGEDHGVFEQRFRSQGEVSLVDLGIDFLVVDAIRLEFYETFDGAMGVVDAEWNGTVWFNDVPGPATPAVVGLGVLAGRRRRR